MNIDKAKSSLDKVLRVVSILSIVAILFAVWFSIRFAKSKTKKEFDQRQIYFNECFAKFNVNWATNDFWVKNNLDQHEYICEQNIGQKNVKYNLLVQINKEKFNDQFNVKSKNLDRPDLYEVVKYSSTQISATTPEIPVYSTHQYFLNTNALVLHKYQLNANTLAGNTSKSMFNTKSILTVNYDSYFDYEGIGKKVLPKDVLLEDQLPYTLRALLFSDTLKVKLNILENQATVNIGDLRVYHATVEVKAQDETSWTVVVALDSNKTNTYIFEKAYPNTLTKIHTWDGRSMTLIK